MRKKKSRIRYVEPLDMEGQPFGRRFLQREFHGKDRIAAPQHPRGWYTRSRSGSTAALVLVDGDETIVAELPKVPVMPTERGEPVPEIMPYLNAFGGWMVYADLELHRRPQVGYIGWLGAEGRGPSRIVFPVFDGTTTMTTDAKVRYGDITKKDGVHQIEGELTVYRALDGKPTTDDSFTINISPDATNGQVDIQLPIGAAGSFVKLITELVAAARRDGLLPAEEV